MRRGKAIESPPRPRHLPAERNEPHGSKSAACLTAAPTPPPAHPESLSTFSASFVSFGRTAFPCRDPKRVCRKEPKRRRSCGGKPAKAVGFLTGNHPPSRRRVLCGVACGIPRDVQEGLTPRRKGATSPGGLVGRSWSSRTITPWPPSPTQARQLRNPAFNPSRSRLRPMKMSWFWRGSSGFH